MSKCTEAEPKNEQNVIEHVKNTEAEEKLSF